MAASPRLLERRGHTPPFGCLWAEQAGRRRRDTSQRLRAPDSAYQLGLCPAWQNFLLTMQRLLSERDHVGVVDDQVGAPTWAGSIAQGTAMLIESAGRAAVLSGVPTTSAAAAAPAGLASLQAIARHLAEQGTLKAQLQPIASSDYPTPAQRPANSRLGLQQAETRLAGRAA